MQVVELLERRKTPLAGLPDRHEKRAIFQVISSENPLIAETT